MGSTYQETMRVVSPGPAYNTDAAFKRQSLSTPVSSTHFAKIGSVPREYRDESELKEKGLHRVRRPKTR